MKSTIQAPKSREELNEELTALKLKIALQEYQTESLETILAEDDGDASAREQLARGEKPTIRRLNRRLRRRGLRRFAARTLPKAGKAAACLILIFYIGLTVAVATVESVRVDLMQFFVRIDGGRASFGFEASDGHLDVPSGWNGYYYPSYIPDGYVLTGVFDDSVVYQNRAGIELRFCDSDPDTRWTVDTENAEIESVTINGRPAVLIRKGMWTTIVWSIDSRCLIVDCAGTKDAALTIAKSVVMIRK